MKSPSIQRSLLIRCGVGVGALLCLTSLSVYLLARHSLFRDIDKSITQTAALLANQVELENEKVTFEWQEGLGSNDALVMEGLFQFWDNRSGNTTRSPALKSQDLPRFQGTHGIPLVKNIVLPNGNRGRAVGLEVHPFILPEEKQRMLDKGDFIDPKSLSFTLVVAGNCEPLHRTLDQLRYVLASGLFLTLALGFTLIDHVIRITLKPIHFLTRQIHERTEHQLDEALTMPVALPKELIGLASNFDSLLARVSTIRQRERDFIRHAAHELRTPIAGLLATTELALSKSRDAETYVKYLQKCEKSAQQLQELVIRLSALARIGGSFNAALKLERLVPRDIIDECLPPFLILAEKRGIEIRIGPIHDGIGCFGDRTLAKVVLNNLLDNAACYTPDNEVICIRCELSEGWVQIIVSNLAEDLKENPERLFIPLFRRDHPACQEGGHLGIGLSLSLDAANAMNGTLKALKTEDEWIEFVFGLPTASS